jgi:hypothetical protein
LQGGWKEILWSALPLRGEDNPGVVEGVATEFRRYHGAGSKSGSCFYATPST